MNIAGFSPSANLREVAESNFLLLMPLDAEHSQSRLIILWAARGGYDSGKRENRRREEVEDAACDLFARRGARIETLKGFVGTLTRNLAG